MNPKDNDELRKAILKKGTVRMAKITISQNFNSNGTVSPIKSSNQEIVEIGIDDLMHLISTHTLRARKDELEHVKDGCIVAEDEPYTTINGKEMPISERIAQIDTEIKKLGA